MSRDDKEGKPILSLMGAGLASSSESAKVATKPEPGSDAYRRTTPFVDKLAELYRRVSYMEKTGFNQGLKYKFMEESELKRRVNLACRELGLIVLQLELGIANNPEQPAGLTAEAPTAAPLTHDCTVRVTITLGDAFPREGQPNAIQLQGIGAAQDRSDKAPMKAMTAAVKTALSHGLLVATGDEPEQDGGVDPAVTRRNELFEQLAGVQDLAQLNQSKLDIRAFEADYNGGDADDTLRAVYKAAAARFN